MAGIPDALDAIVQMLYADSSISAWAGKRIYSAEIPIEDRERRKTPPNTIVVESMPGSGRPDRTPVSHDTYMLKFFASTPDKARVSGYNMAFHRLQHVQNEVHGDGVMIFNATPGAPHTMRDVETEWPCVAMFATIRLSQERYKA